MSTTSLLRLVLLGPPGAGKGTQAQILEKRYALRQISTGDILRRHRADKTILGMEAQPYMDRGDLVPDALIIGMMEADLPREVGFILDGFPRTQPQAEALDLLLRRLAIPLTAVLSFEVEREELIRRLTGRWTNPRTGKVYHTLYSAPRVAGIDDEDGGPLVQRADDTIETVRKRLEVYGRDTHPLIDFYARTGLLVCVDAMRPVHAVTDQIIRAIDARGDLALS
jgi:adenylate kinase